MARIFDGKTYRDETPKETADREYDTKRGEAEAQRAPMSEQEVMPLFIRDNIQTLSVEDAVALRMMDYYPDWDGSRRVEVGEKCVYEGKLYERKQPWNGQEVQPPGVHTAALWRAIEPAYTGEKYDPIPYRPGMTLYKNNYYTEDGVLYLCTQNSGQDMIHPLAQLLEQYVTVV